MKLSGKSQEQADRDRKNQGIAAALFFSSDFRNYEHTHPKSLEFKRETCCCNNMGVYDQTMYLYV